MYNWHLVVDGVNKRKCGRPLTHVASCIGDLIWQCINDLQDFPSQCLSHPCDTTRCMGSIIVVYYRVLGNAESGIFLC